MEQEKKSVTVYSNKVANMLDGFAIISIAIGGIIIGLVLYSLCVGFEYIAIYILGAILCFSAYVSFKAFAEIIQKLQNIEDNTKK